MIRITDKQIEGLAMKKSMDAHHEKFEMPEYFPDDGDDCIACRDGKFEITRDSCYCSATSMPPCSSCENSWIECGSCGFNPECNKSVDAFLDDPEYSENIKAYFSDDFMVKRDIETPDDRRPLSVEPKQRTKPHWSGIVASMDVRPFEIVGISNEQ